jgi:hypothetical protein
MKAAKTKPAPPGRPTLGLPLKRPPMFLCYLCGYRTVSKGEFTDHHQKAHP